MGIKIQKVFMIVEVFYLCKDKTCFCALFFLL
nr:MAG TPA: hypothetical protein [Caudoviricetes sp.]